MFKDWTLQPYLQPPVLFTHCHLLDWILLPYLQTPVLYIHLPYSRNELFKTSVLFNHFYLQILYSLAISSTHILFPHFHVQPCSRTGLFSTIPPYHRKPVLSAHFQLQGLDPSGHIFKTCPLHSLPSSSTIGTHIFKNLASLLNTWPLHQTPGLFTHFLSSSTIGSSDFTHIFKHLASSLNNWPLHQIPASLPLTYSSTIGSPFISLKTWPLCQKPGLFIKHPASSLTYIFKHIGSSLLSLNTRPLCQTLGLFIKKPGGTGRLLHFHFQAL
jgi:hypothetical protein